MEKIKMLKITNFFDASFDITKLSQNLPKKIYGENKNVKNN